MCWLHLFPYRKSVTLPYSSRILNRYSPNLNFTPCFDFWVLCVCVQLFCGPCLNSGLGHLCAPDTVQKLFLTFPNRQYHQGWEGFEGVSLGFQAGLKFSKVPSLVRFFLWLGSTFLAHRSLGLASFSPSLCSERCQSQCSSLLLSAAIPKPLFFQVKSKLIRVGSKGRQDLSWPGNSEEQ